MAKTELDSMSPGPTGGDRRFSNMAGYNHGGRLAVKLRPKPGEVWVTPRGPWKLAETGAAPHRVNHPGTRQGTRAWTRGQAVVFDRLGREVPDQIGDAVEGGVPWLTRTCRSTSRAEDDASKVFQKLARTAEDGDGQGRGLARRHPHRRETGGRRPVTAMFDELDAETGPDEGGGRPAGPAMGPELVGQSAGSTRRSPSSARWVLSIEQIEADADALAAALKKADDVTLKHFSSEADTAGGSLNRMRGQADTAAGGVDKLRDSSDQSRSVLANMVGNSTQDLGALGGVAGSAGVAIGQLGEYATDGNIKLANLAKIAGPMALVTAAGIGVAAAFKTIADTRAFNKQRVEDFTEALDDAVVSAEELQDVLASGDDDKSLMARIGGKTRDVEANVQRVMGTFEEFHRVVEGGTGEFNKWATEQLRIAAAAGATDEELHNLSAAMQGALEDTKLTGAATRSQIAGYEDVVYTAYAAGAAIRQQGTATREAGDDTEFYIGANGELITQLANMPGLEADRKLAIEGTSDALDGATAAQEASATAAAAYRDELEKVTAAAEAHRDAVQANVDALNEQIDATRSAADATIAVSEAQEDFSKAAQESAAIQKDSTKTTEEKSEAVDAERDAMINAADAASNLADQEAAAAGTTRTATQKVDDYNASLLANARFATPAARQAIYDYIIQANQIPEEKATEIRAAVAAGDLPLAESLINQASRTRQTAIIADAHTAQAERDLNYTARTRAALINAQLASTNARLAAAGAYDDKLGGAAAGGPVQRGVPVPRRREGPGSVGPVDQRDDHPQPSTRRHRRRLAGRRVDDDQCDGDVGRPERRRPCPRPVRQTERARPDPPMGRIVIPVSVKVFFGLEYSPAAFFTLDDPVKGVLDGSTYLIASSDGDGVEIGSDGHYITVTRGRSRELDEFETGTATVSLHNYQRTWDALNSAGTYYGDITPGKRVELAVAGETIFTGVIDDWNLLWDVDGTATAEFVAVDAMGQLARIEFDAWTATAAQLSGARISAILDRNEVAFPAGRRDIDTGASTLQGDSVTWGSNVLNYAQLVRQSEQGWLFASRHDLLTFRSRHALVGAAVGLTFADDGGGLAFHGIGTDVGSELLFNRVGVDREGGTLQTVEDDTSQAAYGVRTLSITGLLLDSDGQSSAMAEYLLSIYKDPTARVASVMVKVHGLDAADQASVAAIELGDLIEVVWTPLGVGPPIPQVLLVVEGIRHEVTVDEYTVELSVAPIVQSGVFILDDATWGVLDTGPGVLSF